MKLTTDYQNFRLTFSLERDADYVLHEKFDALNTRTMKMFKKGEVVAYNVLIDVEALDETFVPLSFFESGFLFSPMEDKSLEDLKEVLEESPLIEDVLEKIGLYEKLGTLLKK